MNKLQMFAIVMSLILLVVVIYGMIVISQEATKQCLDAPIKYGINKIGGETSCVCFNPNGNFNIDNDGVYVPEKEDTNYEFKLNITTD